MKKSRFIFSILTIALCVSLITGATFALFTSNDEVNIAVTAGKLEVLATLDDFQTYSMSKETEKNGEFTNGGTASYADGYLTLTNITPGDKVTFDVNIDNKSNIYVKYQITMTITDKVGNLSETLVAIADLPAVGATQLTAPDATQTRWADLDEGRTTFPMSVELPALSGNAYQDNEAFITILVDAVQANHIREPQLVKPVAMIPDENGDYTVTVPGNFTWMAQVIADGTEDFKDNVVTLAYDINVGGDILLPIGNNHDKHFKGTFDGNNRTVRNFLINGVECVALFGFSEGTIKNLTVKDAEITGTHWVAGIVGFDRGSIINCHAINVNVTCIDENGVDGDKAGAIVGQVPAENTKGAFVDNTATNCHIVANRDAGALAGYMVSSKTTNTPNTFTDCTVTWSGFGTGANLATDGDRWYGRK